MKQKLVLIDEDLLAKGNDRYVFQHPHDSQLLIKVVIPGIVKYKSKVREVYRDVKECKPNNQTDSLYIQKIEGLVETNRGVGQVIVKECDEHSDIAPTLYQLALNKELDAGKLQKLNAFLAWFVTTGVIINSLHCKNIVYAWDSARQEYRFKVIDGFGDKTLFQLSKLSGVIRDKNKLKCLKRMLRDLNRLQQA
ncbi:PhoP regulatory network YrbL family protein [Pseudescherichia sp. L3]|uniref:PhoP regulatory network YrbL family protein n=1 Tax=Pseudescherichia sp. L3 TaxID=2970817 RepID=UPI00214FCA67|nr:PhoP regulatory network YrbL family protein [Pseudescherichia sp. L3]MCR4457509.1 PhoP regulatory network YrbL family protein [Pseudescherichia sp. L3]